VIWSAARGTLGGKEAGFRCLGAQTISGNYEGIFGYVSVNHIVGQHGVRVGAGLGVGPDVGSLDLGGASTQITFQPAAPQADILADGYEIRAAGPAADNAASSRVLYSHSYMRSGETQARLRLQRLLLARADTGVSSAAVPNPCLNRGLTEQGGEGLPPYVGSGDWRACSSYAQQLLHLDYECLQQPCALAGTYQPTVRGVAFLAYSGFYHIVRLLTRTTADSWNGTLASLAQAAEGACSIGWEELLLSRRGLGAPDEVLRSLCFGGAYVDALLRGYGFDDHPSKV